MVEHADGSLNQGGDTTVDDVPQEILDKVAANLAALEDDPAVKADKGEQQVLSAVGTSAVSTVESTVSATDSTVSAADSTVSATDSTVSVAVASDKNYDIEDNLYRAAVHQGWKDEQIQEFMKLDPERARATFQNMYETTNKLSKYWSDAGRVKLAQEDQQQQGTQQTQTQTQQQKPKEKIEFTEVDIAKLKEQYDNDPVVDLVDQQQKQNKALFDMVNDLHEAISTRQESAPQTQQTGTGTEAAALAMQVDSFFKQDDMKIFGDFYGSGDNLTPGNQANRLAMFELADQIRAGRALQGLDTSVDEALLQAHLLVSEPVREKMVRQNIVSKLQKRSKSLSLKPGSAGRDVNVVEHTKPTTKEEVIENATVRLSKMNW